jgi:hypothetical protein
MLISVKFVVQKAKIRNVKYIFVATIKLNYSKIL